MSNLFDCDTLSTFYMLKIITGPIEGDHDFIESNWFNASLGQSQQYYRS